MRFHAVSAVVAYDPLLLFRSGARYCQSLRSVVRPPSLRAFAPSSLASLGTGAQSPVHAPVASLRVSAPPRFAWLVGGSQQSGNEYLPDSTRYSSLGYRSSLCDIAAAPAAISQTPTIFASVNTNSFMYLAVYLCLLYITLQHYTTLPCTKLHGGHTTLHCTQQYTAR